MTVLKGLFGNIMGNKNKKKNKQQKQIESQSAQPKVNLYLTKKEVKRRRTPISSEVQTGTNTPNEDPPPFYLFLRETWISQGGHIA